MKKTFNIIVSTIIIIVLTLLWKFIAKSMGLFGYEPFTEGLILMVIPIIFLPIFVLLGILKLVINRNDSAYKKMKFIPILICFVIPVLISFSLNFVYEDLMLINFTLTSIAIIGSITEMTLYIIKNLFDLKNVDLDENICINIFHTF